MRFFATIAAALSVPLLLGSPAAAMSTQPAFAGDFPDPFVLPVTASGAATTYYAYSTGSGGRNLQVISSTDLTTWTNPVDPLPVLPQWASPGLTWAPGVLVRGARYVMYYTVHDKTSGRQCISVATATAPTTFTDTSGRPLVCQIKDGGSIDPAPFVGTDGSVYLLWKSDDNALGQPTQLWAQRLSSDGLSLVGRSPTRLLRASAPWQRGIIEGPSMVYAGGAYYLFYGAGSWSSSAAGIGYATCRSVLGKCTNQSTAGPWLGTHGAAAGPSGPAVFVTSQPGGGTGFKLAYHAWQDGVVGYDNGGKRDLWLDTVTFSSGRALLS